MDYAITTYEAGNEFGWPEGWPRTVRDFDKNDTLRFGETKITKEDYSALQAQLMPAVEAALQKQADDKARGRVKKAIETARFDAETSGITLNGIRFSTDRESVTAISLAGFLTSADETILWKTDDGFHSITGASLAKISKVIRDYVQECFVKEAELQAQLEAAQISDLESVRDSLKEAEFPSKVLVDDKINVALAAEAEPLG